MILLDNDFPGPSTIGQVRIESYLVMPSKKIYLPQTTRQDFFQALSMIQNAQSLIKMAFFLAPLSARDSFVVNIEFEGMTLNEMADPSCANWVHHVQYVLPQVCIIVLLVFCSLLHDASGILISNNPPKN